MDLYKKQTFTIGQFAALHGINKKTLMWYDEIGLLKPAFIRENGYRCYTFKQSAELETILMLRDLHVPLKEIAVFMEKRSAPALADLFAEKLVEVDEVIAYLQALRRTMIRHCENMQRLATLDFDAITLVENHSPLPLFLVPTTTETSLDEAIMQMLMALQKQNLKRPYDAVYGAMLPVTAIYDGRFDDYTSFTIAFPKEIAQLGEHTPPAGTYLRAYHQGDWSELPARYREILAFAARENLELYGYAYETGLNDAVAKSMADSITEILIPVRRK